VRPTRILVVDDSVVARRVISDILSQEGDFEVVGTAPNGKIALAKIERLDPDLVTLDIEMPELDGIETLTTIRSSFPRVRVIMVSNHTTRGASITVEALFLGASDYVTKATKSSTRDGARQYLREQLVPKIRALSIPAASDYRAVPEKFQRAPSRGTAAFPIEVVVIGASTGGPNDRSGGDRCLNRRAQRTHNNSRGPSCRLPGAGADCAAPAGELYDVLRPTT
jgi:two-component system chemotaxis response regulator CheB